MKQLKWFDLNVNNTYEILESTGNVFIGKLLFVMEGADVYDEPEFFLFELEDGNRYEVHHHEFMKITKK
jgi:hypothetical protein